MRLIPVSIYHYLAFSINPKKPHTAGNKYKPDIVIACKDVVKSWAKWPMNNINSLQIEIYGVKRITRYSGYPSCSCFIEIPILNAVRYEKRMVTIQHLKTRLKLACPHCNSKLADSHVYCPGCGFEVEKAVAQSTEHRRLRTLLLTGDTFEMIRNYVNRGGLVLRNGKRLLFGISRNQAWRVARDCAQRAGLRKLANPETGKKRGISPHRLRDVFAVHAVKINDSGDGLRLLQEHLGHASFNTTVRYRKVAGDEHRKWYE